MGQERCSSPWVKCDQENSFKVEEALAGLQMGEPLKGVGAVMKGRLPAVMFMGDRGETKSKKVGLVLERSRGHSFIIAGGKAEGMGADDGRWTGKEWAIIYQHHQICTEHHYC